MKAEEIAKKLRGWAMAHLSYMEQAMEIERLFEEGVVYSGAGIVEQPTLGATRVRLDAKMDTWADGKEYTVIVRRRKHDNG